MSSEPFHEASVAGDVDALRRMFAATPGVLDSRSEKEQLTAFHCAARVGQMASLRWLSSVGANHMATSRNDGTPFHFAVRYGFLDAVRFFVETYGEAITRTADLNGWTALHYAAWQNHYNIAAYLLEQGADHTAKTQGGASPFNRAAWNGRLHILRLMLNTRGNGMVNRKNNQGDTPLHDAASRGHIDIVQCLVGEAGADTTIRNNKGQTPLDCALSNSSEGNEKVVSFLRSVYQPPLINLPRSISEDAIAAYEELFRRASAQGHVECSRLKVLVLGPTLAGKTSLVRALCGRPLPNRLERSIATRFERARLVRKEQDHPGLFEAVPHDEPQLARAFHSLSLQGAHPPVPLPSSPTPSPPNTIVFPVVSAHPHTAEVAASAAAAATATTTTTTTPTASATSASPSDPIMTSIRHLLQTQLQDSSPLLEFFDFAGEESFSCLHNLFMGPNSLYILVIDLSVLHNERDALLQYDALSHWARTISHQHPRNTTNQASSATSSGNVTDERPFHVMVVATHADVFIHDPKSLDECARAVFSSVHDAVGAEHFVFPPPYESHYPFFMVGSTTGAGLADVSTAMHSVVCPRRLPLAWVCVQDLLGRRAREGLVDLTVPVHRLASVVLNVDPLITIGDLVSDAREIREGLLPYLESTADILISRHGLQRDRHTIDENDTVIFNVTQLILAIELLTSVVLAFWKRTKSTRADKMARLVERAGRQRNGSLATRLITALCRDGNSSEEGFDPRVATWLIWSIDNLGRSDEALSDQDRDLLAGANVPDPERFLGVLASLGLVHVHQKRLLVPMLLPETAEFVTSPHARPVRLFLYQVDRATESILPVSLATFHSMLVELWRLSGDVAVLSATQRCSNVFSFENLFDFRIQLNRGEPFVRLEMLQDHSPARIYRTWMFLIGICKKTEHLQWGWRGEACVVPSSQYELDKPLFDDPVSVAAAPAKYRTYQAVHVRCMHKAQSGSPLCNAQVELWWTNPINQSLSVDHDKYYFRKCVLIVAMSKYASSENSVLSSYCDLPAADASASRLAQMWMDRGFTVYVVNDVVTGTVTRETIVNGARQLRDTLEQGIGPEQLLVVHLIGHGASGSVGGLILSDAHVDKDSCVSSFDLQSLGAVLRADVGWPGRNVLVVCDFCNAGSQVSVAGDMTMSSGEVPEVGRYALQVITSSLSYANAYLTTDQKLTQMTSLLYRALGPEQAAFGAHEQVITAVKLRQWLRSLDVKDTIQGFLIARIWKDWELVNTGEILFFRNDTNK